MSRHQTAWHHKFLMVATQQLICRDAIVDKVSFKIFLMSFTITKANQNLACITHRVLLVLSACYSLWRLHRRHTFLHNICLFLDPPSCLDFSMYLKFGNPCGVLLSGFRIILRLWGDGFNCNFCPLEVRRPPGPLTYLFLAPAGAILGSHAIHAHVCITVLFVMSINKQSPKFVSPCCL